MATSSKDRRQREMAEARAARQAQRRAQARQRRQQRLAIVAGFVVVVIAASAIAAILLTMKDDDSDTATAAAAATGSPSTPSAPAAATSKVGACVYTANGEQGAKGATLPKAAASVDTAPATMVINTSAGAITASLDAAKAPCTVHALLGLAETKYFDDTVCHRQTGGTAAGISVLQCGDPTGTGSGSPGFGYANENTEGVNYDRGVLAMAHSAQPDSNGSQFFINYANPTTEGGAALAGKYTVFGKITSGLDVLDKLTSPGVEGGGSDGAPASKAKIKSVTITQGT